MATTAAPSVDLVHCLNAERDVLRQCVDILGCEQQLLTGGEVDALADLCVKKNLLLESASRFSSLRERYLTDNGLPADRTGMNRLLHDNPSLQAIWGEALEWARQANILNSANGAMINVRLSHNRQALSVMHQAVNSHTTYGQDGHLLHVAQGRAISVG